MQHRKKEMIWASSSMGTSGRAGVNPALTDSRSITQSLGAMNSPSSFLRSSYTLPSAPGMVQMALSDARASSNEANTPL